MHLSKRHCGEGGLRALRGASAPNVRSSSNERGFDPFRKLINNTLEISKDDLFQTSPSSPCSSSSSSSTSTFDSLNRIGIIELLDQDLRPTFIIDLEDSVSRTEGVLRPVYCNPLLDTSRSIRDLVLGKALVSVNGEELLGEEKGKYAEFVSWAYQPVAAQSRDASLLSVVFDGICWMASTLQNRWRVVTGNNYTLLSEENAAHTPSFLGHKRVEVRKSFLKQGLDIGGLVKLRESLFGSEAFWRASSSYPELSTHHQLVANTDWASTSLGPMEAWSPQLNHLSNIVMAEPTPSILFWGEENFLIYNETYAPFLGDKHPSAMGSTAEATLPEIWEFLKGILEQGRKTCQPIRVDSTLFELQRKGFLEETYFDSTFLPLINEQGDVIGFHESVLESTAHVFSKRRDETLRYLHERMCQAQNLEDFWKEVANVAKQNPLDMPFVLCYSTKPDLYHSSKEMFPQTQTGLKLDLFMTERGRGELQDLLEKSLENVKQAQQVLVIKGTRFAEAMNVETVVTSPIPYTTEAECAGLVIIGLSPRQVYDKQYQAFINSFLSKLDASFLETTARHRQMMEREEREEKIRLEKAKLAEQLRASETKFERLAESAPVGIWVIGNDGRFIFRNAEWFEIMRSPRNQNTPFCWEDLVHEDDEQTVKRVWKEMEESRETRSYEFKLKRIWDGAAGLEIAKEAGPQNAWIYFSSHPNEYFGDGSVKSFVGCVTEISQLKWAEGEQARHKEEALRSKKQQEAFIDMVSHEIRNPLAAIIQSADGILSALEGSENKETYEKDVADSAQVILTCAFHQKRIVDDILSMSKLDSDLLDITPVSAKPVAIAQQALNMLNSEAKNAGIPISLNLEPSYQQLGVDHVYLDPSRLTQVLINLITNAIKFTQFQPTRSISVRVGASLTKPSLQESGDHITYVQAKSDQQDVVAGADWGTGEVLFITFSVQDTGRGLNAEEKKLLFQRFSQASPKTHVQYGGSGLGLFISRTLAEKQGGEIGVASESGVGSVFAFFIMVRKVMDAESTSPNVNGTRKSSPGQHDGNELTSTLKPENQKATNPVPKNLHILITEDNLINQTVLRKQLLPHCTSISLANHGLEALSYLRTTTFHRDNQTPQTNTNTKTNPLSCILMDQEMPSMDGLTCIRAIRAMEKTGELIRHVPVIGITANARRRQVEVLLEGGMDDVLLKPFRVGEVLERIWGVVGRGEGKGEGEGDGVGDGEGEGDGG